MKKVNFKPVSTLEEWDCGRFNHDAAVKEVDNLLENFRLWQSVLDWRHKSAKSQFQELSDHKIKEHSQDIIRNIYDPFNFSAHRLVNVFTMLGPASKIEHGSINEDVYAKTKIMKAFLCPETVSNLAMSYNAINCSRVRMGVANLAIDQEYQNDSWWEYLDVIALDLRMEILREIIYDIKNNTRNLFSEKFHNIAQIRNIFSKVITKMQSKTGVAPNWIVTNPKIVNSFNQCRFIDETSIFKNSLGIKPLCIIRIDDKDLLVFSDPLFPQNEMLFGYKGTKKHPSPYYYAPYIPITLNPANDGRQGIMNRYAKKLMAGGAAYYGRLIIDNIEVQRTTFRMSS